MSSHCLVHANIALAKFPFDSQKMASFFEQVARINQIGYDTKGFVDEPELIDKGSCFNLKTAVKSRKYSQSLTAPDLRSIELMTNKVTTSIKRNPVTAIAHESFPR